MSSIKEALEAGLAAHAGAFLSTADIQVTRLLKETRGEATPRLLTHNGPKCLFQTPFHLLAAAALMPPVRETMKHRRRLHYRPVGLWRVCSAPLCSLQKPSCTWLTRYQSTGFTAITGQTSAGCSQPWLPCWSRCAQTPFTESLRGQRDGAGPDLRFW